MRISDLSEQQFLRYYETRLAEKQFRRSGVQYKALCPFHPERSPSLAVNASEGTWYCHGACAKGGGAIEFGTPRDADVVRKRKFYPLLEKLGIEKCGFHAFRHGNETVMDQESVPMAVRQSRLGHSDART